LHSFPYLNTAHSVNPLELVLRRWWLIVGLTVIAATAGYAVSARKAPAYESSALVQIVLSSQQTGAYVDPNTLDELTNVYLEVARNYAVDEDAARVLGTSAQAIDNAVTPSVSEPGVLSFTAESSQPAAAASYANAVANAFAASVAQTAATQLHSRVASLEARATALQAGVARLPLKSPLLTADSAQLSTVENQIASLLGTPGTVAEIIQPARASSASVSPKPVRTMIIAALLALVIGIALAYGRGRLARGFESPDHAATELGLPVLAVVPRSKALGREVADATRLAVNLLRVRSSGTHPSGRPGGVVMLASADDGDGKTFLAQEIMSLFAAEHGAALIVDADLRSRELSTNVHLSESEGMAELLTSRQLRDGSLSSDDLRALLARPALADGWEASEVRVLAAGRLAQNGATSISGETIEKAIGQLVEIGMPIYIDSPALLTSSDGLLLARHATDVVLVLHAKRTKRRDAMEALWRLESVGANVRGIVYNCSSARVHEAYLSSQLGGTSTNGGRSPA
jgi:polysaccharide biosynthesis transport protein